MSAANAANAAGGHRLRVPLEPGDALAAERASELLWALGCAGVEERGDALLGYFAERPELPPELARRAAWERIEARDWVGEYYAGLAPVRLGRLVIAPTHAAVELRAPQRPLWLDPGLAFGSGHHETTRLALRALEAADPAGLRVLDVGAGSGILAIAADLLGAAEARGLDTDGATVPVARANARLNGSRARFEARSLPTDGDDLRGWADLLVANIYAEVHVALAGAYRAALAPGGRLLLTGILAERQESVEAALAAAGFALGGAEADDVWRLVRARAPGGADGAAPP